MNVRYSIQEEYMPLDYKLRKIVVNDTNIIISISKKTKEEKYCEYIRDLNNRLRALRNGSS